MKKIIVHEDAESRLVVTASFDRSPEHFSITADLFMNGDREASSTGCLHQEIEERLPHLKPLIRVHLRDYFGHPMHYLDNCKHWIRIGQFYKAAEYLRCTIEDVQSNTLDQLIERAGPIWAAEAEEARNLLKSLPDIEIPETFLARELRERGYKMRLLEGGMNGDRLTYVFEIRKGSKRIKQKFETGIMYGKVTLEAVVSCIMSDFDFICCEDEDSFARAIGAEEKEGRKIYFSIVRNEKKWRNFLGDDFDVLRMPGMKGSDK